MCIMIRHYVEGWQVMDIKHDENIMDTNNRL